MIARILQDAASSLPALWRLARFRDDWRSEIDASTEGFVRSFAGPVLALPFSLAAVATLAATVEGGAGLRAYWYETLAHVVSTLAYPAAMAVVTRLMGGGAGYTGLIVTVNWASLWLAILLAAIAMLQGAGIPGDAIQLVGVGLLSLGLYLTWRAARELLTGEISVTILAVLLAFGSKIAGYVAAAALVALLW